jgi:hypothetical protein
MRTAKEPLDCIIHTTINKFLEEAESPSGRVLNAVCLPMHLTNFPDPEGFMYIFLLLFI